MLEKLAKQTAIYGISTIVVRFLSYLLTPYYTRIFGQETYGIVTDVYALIPLALTLLTMGMESSYFRFSAKAEEAGGDVRGAKRRLFATTWGATSLAAALFFAAILLFRDTVARAMGEAYVAHPEYIVWVGLIILFDVSACIPFSRLREQGRSMTFVGLKALNVVLNVVLAVAFGAAGLFRTEFGVGWVFVANLAASVVTWAAILATTDRTLPRIDGRLLRAVFAYSLPLLVGGLAGTANEFIDRQLIKYLVPAGAMAQLGVYGAITKIAVVMMLFYQMYRLAAEPFFLSNFRKEEFVAMNAAALKYYVMASMLIFLGIALFRDLFALIVGRDFREGIFILPVVLGANVLTGVWLNLSFWYKREERTSLAIVVTGTGLVAILLFGFALIPRWGYYGAAWARLASETAMVAVSWWLNRRFFPTPYDWRRMGEYVAVALAVFAASEAVASRADNMFIGYTFNIIALAAYVAYLVRRERIDLRAMMRAVLKRS
ncbi:oligosaccharide flippase family protein [uncultured Alistipes sp.]|uniref:lipopolysaccharide biosynthesis protein n=1 Tax=uncultured Alistipes sp. TaxID=538949 RepID=UPI002621702E|nr:oligosaccharide flippase family protein [uncultured Alistipes sp.]